MRFNFISLVVLSAVTILFSCRSDNTELLKARQKAIRDIELMSNQASFHQDALNKMKDLVNEAECNIDLILQTAAYISKVPFETVTLLRIAEIAAKAKRECPGLIDLVDLTILGVGRSDEIVQLAERYVEVEDAADIREIENTIEQLRSHAMYDNVQEALQEIKQSY